MNKAQRAEAHFHQEQRQGHNDYVSPDRQKRLENNKLLASMDWKAQQMFRAGQTIPVRHKGSKARFERREAPGKVTLKIMVNGKLVEVT